MTSWRKSIIFLALFIYEDLKYIRAKVKKKTTDQKFNKRPKFTKPKKKLMEPNSTEDQRSGERLNTDENKEDNTVSCVPPIHSIPIQRTKEDSCAHSLKLRQQDL